MHGRFNGTVEEKDGKLVINGQAITVFSEKGSIRENVVSFPFFLLFPSFSRSCQHCLGNCSCRLHCGVHWSLHVHCQGLGPFEGRSKEGASPFVLLYRSVLILFVNCEGHHLRPCLGRDSDLCDGSQREGIQGRHECDFQRFLHHQLPGPSCQGIVRRKTFQRTFLIIFLFFLTGHPRQL